MQGPIDMVVGLETEQLEPSAVDELARRLREELREADVVAVELAERPGEPGSKGPAVDVGILLVAVLPSAIPALITTLGSWLRRRQTGGLTIRVKVKEGEMAVQGVLRGAGPEEIARLTTQMTIALRQAGRTTPS
jgi:hypothetical protein